MSGDHAVRLGNDASIGQVVQVEKGSEYAITFSAARTCAQLESLNVSVLGGASQTVDLQTLYNIEGWDAYALAFQATDEQASLEFRNPGMEDDPTCGPILDNVAIKKLFTPDKPKGMTVLLISIPSRVYILTGCLKRARGALVCMVLKSSLGIVFFQQILWCQMETLRRVHGCFQTRALGCFSQPTSMSRRLPCLAG